MSVAASSFDIHIGQYEQLSTRYEVENECLWYAMHAEPRACFNPTLLSEIAAFQQEVGHLVRKYLKGKDSIPVEHRIKMFRLVEKLAMESADTISDIHGGGSPEAHRVTILRESDLDKRKKAAKRLAGIDENEAQ